MRNFKLLIYVLLFTVIGCNPNNKKVTLYIVNNSRVVKDVNINVEINNSSIVNQKFTYSGITPDYTTFIQKYKKGIYSVKVKANNQSKEDTFKLDNDIYLYISYDAALKENGDTSKGLAIYKTYTKYTHY